jgi:hypothetical protein
LTRPEQQGREVPESAKDCHFSRSEESEKFQKGEGRAQKIKEEEGKSVLWGTEIEKKSKRGGCGLTEVPEFQSRI